jgi:hypothetical protein
MFRLFGIAGLAALLALTVSFAKAEADKKKTASIEDIMKKAHDSDEGYIKKVRDDLKEDKPDWKEIQKITKDWAKLAPELGKNKPPKGAVADWKKKAAVYTALVVKVEKAADKKNKGEAQKVLTTMNLTCGACHKAHKKDD